MSSDADVLFKVYLWLFVSVPIFTMFFFVDIPVFECEVPFGYNMKRKFFTFLDTSPSE
jgi:hypothetical protein